MMPSVCFRASELFVSVCWTTVTYSVLVDQVKDCDELALVWTEGNVCNTTNLNEFSESLKRAERKT